MDATGSPRLLPQCEGIEDLKTDQSERPRRMSKIVEGVVVPRRNSPNKRSWNGRCWRKAVVQQRWLVRSLYDRS
jgi:hypothetical protein